MATIVTRSGKGSPLTNNEVDANFINLNTELGTKVNASSLAAVATSGAYADLSGRPTNVSSFANDSGYLTSFTEADPTVPSHVKSITTTNISNWDAAFSWGNHASAGYLTSFTEADPTVPSHVKAITTTNISNWNTAFGWGNHASAGYLTGITSGQITTALGYTPAASGANSDITSMTGVTGGISSPDFVQFDTTATVTPATGRLYFNDGEGGLSYTLKGGNVVQEVGQSQQVLIYNGTGAALTKGQVVYSNGAQGQRPTVALALATGDATSARTLGIVAEAIADGAEGWVSTLGIVENIDTSAFAAGAQLYLSGTTAGGLTATKPVAPLHMVYVARCIKSHATSGRLFVTVQNGYELDELHDVSAVSPANNDGIFYNTSTSLWEKKSIVTALGYTPYNSTNPAGYITSSALSDYLPLTGGSLNVGGVSNTHQFLYNESGAEIQLIDSTGAGPILIDNVSGLARFYKVGSGAMSIGTTGANYLQYITNGSERMRINSSGFVGIGTSSPQVRLQVSSTDQSESRLRLQNTGSGGTTFDIVSGNPNVSNAGLAFYDATNAATRMYIDSSGSVVIGGTNAISSAVKLTLTDGTITQAQGYFTGGVSYQGTTSNHPTAFLTNNAERMRIGSNGCVAIGGTATDATLHITAALGGFNRLTQMSPSGTSQDAFNLIAAKNSGGSELWWSWGVDTSNRWRINQGVGFANNGLIMDDVGQITSADVAAAFGYKGLPQNQQTSAYTLALSDIGKHLYVTAGAFAVTIPADGTLNFPVGAAITFVCEDAGKTIVPASGVTLVLAGTGAATTGTRTLAIGSVATLIKVQANRWYISGTGVT